MTIYSRLGVSMDKVPDIAGMNQGRAIVCGGGRCLWDDLERLGCRSKKHMGSVVGADFMVVNTLGETFPGVVKHWFSNSGKELQAYRNARRTDLVQVFDRPHEYPTKYHSLGGPQMGREHHIWPWPGHGSSGLNAVYTALGLGYEEIILCGIPGDQSGHYFDPPWRESNFEVESPTRLWERAQVFFDGRVKSMSGNTRGVLGEP